MREWLGTASSAWGVVTSCKGLYEQQSLKGPEQEHLFRSSALYLLGSLKGLLYGGGETLWLGGAYFAYHLAVERSSTAARLSASLEAVNYTLSLTVGRSLVSQTFGATSSTINAFLTLSALAHKPIFGPNSLPQTPQGKESTHMPSFINWSDTIGQALYAGTPAKTEGQVKTIKSANWQLAKSAYNNTSKTERVMRLLKCLEPVCLAFSLLGWSGGPATQGWFKSTRALITVIVRVPKAVDALANPIKNTDAGAWEDGFRVIAGPCYASLAVASALAEMGKLDILTPMPGVPQFLKYGGTMGNLLAGTGGFYCWLCQLQRFEALKQSVSADNKELSDIGKLRFKMLSDGMRYSLEGLVGLAAIMGLKYTPWQTVGTKFVPAFIGVYAGWMQDHYKW